MHANHTSVAESYITHIRIMEDSAYPSAPPPPTSNPDLKKARIIIVAVRNSGQVRMHKARENANGTFSIGKTWLLDDLTAVESFNGIEPINQEEAQRKQWGGPSGFVVTLGKPYYWQASTPKEKQFFIASLVKIFTKYTNGRSPVLVGFDAREREQLANVSTVSNANRSRPGSSQSSAPAPSFHQGLNPAARRDGSHERSVRGQASREAMSRPPALASTSSSYTTHSSRSQAQAMPRPRRDDSEGGSLMSATSGRQQNDHNLRQLASANRSQDTFGTARSDDTPPPSRSRGPSNGPTNYAGMMQEKNAGANTYQREPSTMHDRNTPVLSPVEGAAATASSPFGTALPERRRPPIAMGEQRDRRLDSSEGMVPAPLKSPAVRKDDIAVPSRSAERLTPREGMNKPFMQNESDNRPPVTPVLDQRKASGINNATSLNDGSNSIAASAETNDQIPIAPPAEPEEDLRPGLGPMIKKKSNRDLANTFLKAAKTVNAFKPRAGGAAERMREALAKTSNGPDGITGVVPAPQMPRTTSTNSTVVNAAISSPATPSSPRKTNDKLPNVKIVVPESDRPSSISGPNQVQEKPSSKEAPQTKEKQREPRRIKPASEVMQRELASLGVDPSFLDGRGNELVQAWDEFGWSGTGVHSNNIDQMKDSLDRQLDKMQAQGWLKAFEEQDEKVLALNQLFDTCIDECDALDGLLTLYSVELGVSIHQHKVPL